MPVTIEKLPDQPVIVITVTEPFDHFKELPAGFRKFQELAASVQGTIYRIIDVTGWRVPFNAVVDGLAADTRGGAATDPRVRTVLVGSGEMVELGVKAVKQRQYGGREMALFASMDEALAYVNAELAKE